MISLKAKVAVVTGASSGIGRATALELCRRGAFVVAAARRWQKLVELKEQMTVFNPNCLVLKTDVTREEEVSHLFDEAENRFGRIDILVNNAGRGLKSDIIDTRYHDWESVLQTNLSGVFLCAREALKRMIHRKVNGHIITVSSIAGLYGTAGFSAYCAAKHGVTGFQRSLRWEARKYGIKVSTIFPGRVDTEFFDVYAQKPSTQPMLSPKDLARYIAAVAERNLFKRQGIRIMNLGKRVAYMARFKRKN